MRARRSARAKALGWAMAGAAMLAAASAGAQAPSAPGQEVRQGMWEISVDAKVDAEPGFVFPSQATKQCFTAAEAKNPAAMLGGLQGGAGAGACSFVKSSAVGAVLDFEMACSGPLAIDSSGKVRFGPDSFSGAMTSKMRAADGVVEFKSSISGRRVGDC